MIFSDRRIKEEVSSGNLGIENFEEFCLQPASYDLRIGPLVYSPSSSQPDKPYDMSSNGGAYRIPPYGTAVLMTYETLRLPDDIVGRFGLKSAFARRGLLASTGPQVDPGFEGKLFVSIFNLTPAAHVLTYKDTFLSIEFHKLDQKPEKTYDGPYQHRRDIGPEILEDMARLEGLNLTQMQNQFSELAQHVKEWHGLAQRFEEFIAEMGKQTKAIAGLAKQIADSQASPKTEGVIEARHLDIEQAMQEILSLFRKRRRLFYSDIAESLKLDYDTVIHACERLEQKGLIEGDLKGDKNGKKKAKRSRG